jgi:outer membrane protein OmpA-like peptidoglycan-associated protein
MRGLKLFSLLLFLSSYFIAYSQDDCPEPKKKAEKFFKAAQTSRTFDERYKLLIEAINMDPNYLEAYDELAALNEKKAQTARTDKLQVQHLNRMLDYLNKINEICPNYRGSYAAMKLGEFYFSKKMYAQAEPYFKQVLKNPNVFKKDERIAHERLEQIETYFNIVNNPVPFQPEKVKGPSTKNDEYLPMLSPDNKYLFFTRQLVEDDKAFSGKVTKELFMRSRRLRGNEFSEGFPMPSPFNLGQYQGGVSISVDNKLLFVTIVEVIPYPCDDKMNPALVDLLGSRHPGFDNGDIYYSEYIDGEWTKLQSVGSGVNSPCTWESQPSISADNKTLYFARQTDPFNYGDIDIFKSERQPDGTWGEAVNLGEPINTKGNEKSPFMHSDSYTLYFASDGHIGVGGYDIFYSKLDPKTGLFSKPKNLGVPINTEKDEHGFVVSRDGTRGYYGAADETKNLDIYSFELYKEARPEKVVFVEGKIVDEKGEVPEQAQVIIKNVNSNTEIEGVVDQNTGDYVAVIAVKEGEDLMLTAKKKGYAFSSQLITSETVVEGKPVKTKPVEIKPIEVGKSYTINNIQFATDSYELNEKSIIVLNEFISFLKENPTIKVAIHGHTDNVGDAEKNMLLSENRAKAVYNYLILEDIAPERLSYKGFGPTKPIADNNTEEGRAKNRRTEFVIVEK